MLKYTLYALLIAGLSGCGTLVPGAMTPIGTPPTSGETESGFTYIPIDPFPVETVAGEGCKTGSSRGQLLDALPDNAVRMLVERFDTSGGVTFGASKVTASGETYRVTVDFINADTINVPIRIRKMMRHKQSHQLEPVNLFQSAGTDYEAGSEVYDVSRADDKAIASPEEKAFMAEYNIPVYVGVGLRVSANVYVISGDTNISGIGVIGAEAEASRLRGSLIVQTLGINGKAIAAALPIQSELNRTTAQNAIVAVGSIKALLYADETVKSPRVVGLYLPFQGGKPLVNALISELSKRRVRWERPCLVPAGGKG